VHDSLPLAIKATGAPPRACIRHDDQSYATGQRGQFARG
jgi:hypothetical protein